MFSHWFYICLQIRTTRQDSLKFCGHCVLTHTFAPIMDAWLLAPFVMMHSVIVKKNKKNKIVDVLQ